MEVKFLDTIYSNFEKNPKARSEWAESQVRNFIKNKIKFFIKLLLMDERDFKNFSSLFTL